LWTINEKRSFELGVRAALMQNELPGSGARDEVSTMDRNSTTDVLNTKMADDDRRCPRCGSHALKLIAEEEDDLGSFLGSVKQLRTKTRVFECRCGMAFTESDEPQSDGESVLD
jgi:hypothetical protein